MNNFSDKELRESRLAEYKEVGQNFRTLTEIRFKLLGLLPLGTALSALATAWGKAEFSMPLSLFGLTVTVALIVYNERNDQLYDELVARAAQLERVLGLPDGYFSERQGTWLQIHPIPQTPGCKFAVPIGHRWAIGTIYRASIVAWLFMFFFPTFGWLITKLSLPTGFDCSLAAPIAALLAVITAFSVGNLFLNCFEAQKRNRERCMRRLAEKAVAKLAALNFSPLEDNTATWTVVFSAAACLRGGEFNEEFHKVLGRARFYLSKELRQSTNNMYYPLPPLNSPRLFGERTAACLMSLLTDLPARRLIDEYYDRLGYKEESAKDRNKARVEKVTELIAKLGEKKIS